MVGLNPGYCARQGCIYCGSKASKFDTESDITDSYSRPARTLEPRICALLMRAGAKLPIPGPGSHQWLERSPYLLKIHRTPGGILCRSQNCTTRAIGALDDLRTGGFGAYEKAHRQRLTAIFLPKFPSLPAEIVSHIVSFGFNCGCYEFDAVEPVAHRTRSKGG